MPLPFVLAGLAAAAGAAGVIKGGKAISDNSKAKELISNVQYIYDLAKDRLESQRQYTANDLNTLGEVKLNSWSKEIGRFVDLFGKFKKVDIQGKIELNSNLKMSNTNNIKNMQSASLKATEIVKGGVASLGAGALAGIASYGGAMMFASASTGTAIATLSGAAATNATLAWFGGGSLAAGGAGMAGGTLVLGGIVAGPVLAVAGFIMAAKAEENLAKAKKTYSEAENAAERMNTMVTFLERVSRISNNYKDFLVKFGYRFSPILSELDNVYNEALKEQEKYFGNKIRKSFGLRIKIDYRKLTQSQQRVLHISWLMAQILYKVLAAPLLDKNGDIVNDAERILIEAKDADNNLIEANV